MSYLQTRGIIDGLSVNPVQRKFMYQLDDLFDPADDYDQANYVAAFTKYYEKIVKGKMLIEEDEIDMFEKAMDDWNAKKPEQQPYTEFENPWFLITSYGDYDVADNILNIPEIISNFTRDDVDLSNDQVLRQEVMEQVLEFGDAPSMDKPINVYVIEFGDADTVTIFEDILMGLSDNELDTDGYEIIINTLSRQKLITFNKQ